MILQPSSQYLSQPPYSLKKILIFFSCPQGISTTEKEIENYVIYMTTYYHVSQRCMERMSKHNTVVIKE